MHAVHNTFVIFLTMTGTYFLWNKTFSRKVLQFWKKS